MAGLFEGRFRPRRCLDIRVGKFHILEVLLHVRRADYEYFQANDRADENEPGEVTAEFLELLQERILPRMFGNELEAHHRAKNPGVLPPESSDYYGDVATGNTTKKGKKRAAPKVRGKMGAAKASNATSTADGAKKKKTNSGTAAAFAALEDEDGAEKTVKDVYFSFGDTIQLAYRREPTTSSRTIFFGKKEDQDKDNESIKPSSGFHDYIKLSHRLVIWISKLNPEQKTTPDPKGVGFYRPEMIPTSSLFRQPKDILNDDSDDN
jgi:hypothetical protein